MKILIQLFWKEVQEVNTVVLHKGNVTHAIYMIVDLRPEIGDTLTKQIMIRQKNKKYRYLARMIVLAKIKSCA